MQSLLLKITENPDYASSIAQFQDHFSTLPAANYHSSTPWGHTILLILNLRHSLKAKNYSDVLSLSHDHLFNPHAKLDFLTAILINYYFRVVTKKSTLDPKLFFALLTFHKEVDNCECVSVLTNICLKLQIDYQLEIAIDGPVELQHQGLFSFYKGLIALDKQRYADALDYFKFSSILRESKLTESCLIVTSLLLNEYYRPKPLKRLFPYLQLKSAVDEGSAADYAAVVAKYAPEFRKDRLYEPILRLEANVAQQNFKKIAKVYSQISVKKLLRLGVKNDLVCDKSGIVRFEMPIEKSHDVAGRITECTELENKIKSMMSFRDPEPLCFETVSKYLQNNL